MRFLVLLCVIFSLAACGRERPLPVNHPMATETVIASATHWQDLAADVADNLLAAQPGINLVAVDTPDDDSPFGVNFREMLITELFKRGFEVADSAPTHVAFDWHVVRHPPEKAAVEGKAFELVGAGAGIYGLYRLARDNLAPLSGAALGATAAGGLIAGSWIADNTNNEVVITTTVLDGPHIIHRQTDIYYLETGESSNFKSSKIDQSPNVTFAQSTASAEGLSDVTQKAETYCAKQNAKASLVRRYVKDGVRYNRFACLTESTAEESPDDTSPAAHAD